MTNLVPFGPEKPGSGMVKSAGTHQVEIFWDPPKGEFTKYSLTIDKINSGKKQQQQQQQQQQQNHSHQSEVVSSSLMRRGSVVSDESSTVDGSEGNAKKGQYS